MPRWTWDVSPVLLQNGTSQLRWYNILLLLEMALAFGLLLRQVRRGRGDAEDAGDLAVHVYIGALVGARVGHCLFYDFDRLVGEPAWLFQIWKGGLASHGAALGVLFAAFLFARRRAMPLWETTDRLTPPLALVAVIHRFANLMNSEIAGKRTDGTWGMRIPRYDVDSLDFSPLRHPTHFYEALLGVLVLVALVVADRAWKREARPRGALTGLFLLTYFTGRFFVELFKEPEGPQLVMPLNMAQLLSLPFFVFGAWLLLRSLKARERAGWVLAG
jgi:phosphatidylglycerol---prolipoprotein diacylglyceryl transferase